jgi:hypothetical protein
MRTPGADARAHAEADDAAGGIYSPDEPAAGRAAMDGILRSLMTPAAARHAPATAHATARPSLPGPRVSRHRSPGADSPREVIVGCLVDAGVHPAQAASYAAQVCQAFRGCLVRFHAAAIDHRHRDEAVRAARAAGAFLGSLAQRFKLSRTQVRRICREL